VERKLTRRVPVVFCGCGVVGSDEKQKKRRREGRKR